MWDANSFAQLAVFKGKGGVKDRFYCVAVSHDGSLVVGGTLSNEILVYQIAGHKEKDNKFTHSLKGHNGAVTALRFGPAESPLQISLFSCSKDMQLRRWNIATQKCEMEYTGNLLLAEKGGKASALPSVDGKRGHMNEVHNFAFRCDHLHYCLSVHYF